MVQQSVQTTQSQPEVASLSPEVLSALQAALRNAAETGNVSALNLTDLAGLFQGDRQFNAANELRVAEANQAARLRIAELNASLRAQQGQLTEQVRQFEIQDARERENMRFLLRKEQVATEEGNRAALQNALALQEQISSRLENNRFQRQQLVTEVQGLNAQIENNVRVFNAQEQARVEQLNDQRRQANLQQLQSVSSQIGELAQNPADVGKLAAFLRSGNRAPISSAIARGENAITDESLLGLRGLLGVREGLQQGPTLATANRIDGQQIAVPQFGELGPTPEIASMFSPSNFDPTGIERGASPAAGDFSQAFQPVLGVGEIQAPSVEASPVTAAVAPPAVAPPPPSSTPTFSTIDPTLFKDATQRFIEAMALTSPNVNFDVDPNLTPERLEKFFKKGPTGDSFLEIGGVARPGQPVIVGDSSDGKENQELAMVDG